MTGDVTGVAQSPFARAGAHLGSNKQANQIRRKLESEKIKPEECDDIAVFVYGPVLRYWHQNPRHREFDSSRRTVAALERRLWDTINRTGYAMLNGRPTSQVEANDTLWRGVLDAFAPHFDLARERSAA